MKCLAAAAAATIACRAPVATPLATRADPAIAVAADARVVELDGATFAIAPTEIAVFRSGIAVTRAVLDHPIAIGATGILPAPTGEGRWVVAVIDGALVHVTLAGELEPIGDRVGAVAAPTAIASAGATFALLEGGAIAVAIDGAHVARYRAAHATAIAVARDRLAVAWPDRVELWDLAHGTSTRLPIANARVGFVDAERPTARLVAASARAVFVEARPGGVVHRHDLPAPIEALATSGGRAWLAAGGRVFALDRDTVAALDARAPALVAAEAGDAWAIARGAITHLAIARPDASSDDAWRTAIAPVFGRVCAKCHLPGGDAGVDLSSPAAWLAERDEISRRVAARTMPPEGTLISDGDRAAIVAWLARH